MCIYTYVSQFVLVIMNLLMVLVLVHFLPLPPELVVYLQYNIPASSVVAIKTEFPKIGDPNIAP